MSLLVNSQKTFIQNQNAEFYPNYPAQFYPVTQSQQTGDYFYPSDPTQNFQNQIQNYQILPAGYSASQSLHLNQQQEQYRFANALNQNFLQNLNQSGFTDLQRRGFYQGGSVFQTTSSPEYQQSYPGLYNNNISVTASDRSQISPVHHGSSASVVSTPEPSPNFLQYQWEGFNTEETYLPVQENKSDLGFQNSSTSSIQTSSSAKQDEFIIKEVQYTPEPSDQQLVIELDDRNVATITSSDFEQTPSPTQNWNNDDDDDFGSRNVVELGINLEDIPDNLPDLKDSDLLLNIPDPNVPGQSTLSNLIDNCIFSSKPAPNAGQQKSKTPHVFINIQPRTLRKSPDLYDDHDDCLAYPAGSIEQTRALASSQFMKKFRSHIDFLKATRGPLLPVSILAREKKPGSGKVVQPQRRQIKKEENPGSIPDVIQMDLTKLDQSGSFNFGFEEWTLSFDKNPKFKKFFFEGKIQYFQIKYSLRPHSM
jgi:hypothetical protein